MAIAELYQNDVHSEHIHQILIYDGKSQEFIGSTINNKEMIQAIFQLIDGLTSRSYSCDDIFLDFIQDLLDVLNSRYCKLDPAGDWPRGSKFRAQVHAEPWSLGYGKLHSGGPQHPEKFCQVL